MNNPYKSNEKIMQEGEHLIQTIRKLQIQTIIIIGGINILRVAIISVVKTKTNFEIVAKNTHFRIDI